MSGALAGGIARAEARAEAGEIAGKIVRASGRAHRAGVPLTVGMAQVSRLASEPQKA
jgi:hypothetical protein